MEGFIKCLQRMVPNPEAHKTIHQELQMYRNIGGLFGFDTIIWERKLLMPSMPLESGILVTYFI
jgi:hypothetical protein